MKNVLKFGALALALALSVGCVEEEKKPTPKPQPVVTLESLYLQRADLQAIDCKGDQPCEDFKVKALEILNDEIAKRGGK